MLPVNNNLSCHNITSPTVILILRFLVYFREVILPETMAKLIQKLPALLNTTREIATPKLNTFWKYAKVGGVNEIFDSLTSDHTT